jgi:hypothetical protein
MPEPKDSTRVILLRFSDMLCRRAHTNTEIQAKQLEAAMALPTYKNTHLTETYSENG